MSEMSRKLDSLKIDRPDETPRRRWWIPVLVIFVLALLAGTWFGTRPSESEVVTALAREVTTTAQQTVLNATGYVTARRQATVSSKVTGKVLEVLIEEGMHVEKEQVLARLDDANARAARALGAAQLEAARTELAETRVRRHEAGLDKKRLEALVAEGFASQAELDAATANVDSLEARLESQHQAVAVAKRSLALSQQSLDDTVIRAPFEGIVVAKNAQPGEMISPMSAGGGFTRTGIGTIVDMSSLEIEVEVNEAYINRVAPEQRIEATLDAYPEWKIPGHVIAIIPTADRQTATVEVRVGFDSLDPRILPDMGIKVAFQGIETETSTGRAVVVVPHGAIRSDAGTDVVFVVSAGVAERRAIKVGEKTADGTTVLAGLSGGERVILEGPDELADGAIVKERD